MKNGREEITISALKANLWALFGILPLCILFFLLFFLIFGWEKSYHGLLDFQKYIIPIIIAGIVIHEFLHGFVWSLFCEKGFKSIKFGVIWENITPYTHCREYLSISNYRLGTLAPGFVLGIIPLLLSFSLGSGILLVIGCLNILAAGGDIIMLWLLSKTDKHTLVLDHPNKIGCIIQANNFENDGEK